MNCLCFIFKEVNMLKLFFCLMFMFSFFSLRAQHRMGKGEKISSFSLTDQTGNSVTFQDLKGELFVFDFWATWCAPCLKSIPAMQEVEKEFQDHEEIVFLYVNTLEFQGRDIEFIDKFLKNKGLELFYYLDRENGEEMALSKSLDLRTLPSKLIVSKNGEVLYRDFGYSGSPEEFVSHMRKLIFQFLSN